MATPPTAIVWPESMDPAEELDWIADLSSMLEADEAAELNYTIELSPEAIDAGLMIMSGAGRSHQLIDGRRAILVWLMVSPGRQSDPMFSGGGTSFPIEVTFYTNSVPSRKRQRTYVLRIAQR